MFIQMSRSGLSVIDLILQNHGRDFEASVNGSVANHIHNFAARDRQEIEDAVLSGSGAEQAPTPSRAATRMTPSTPSG